VGKSTVRLVRRCLSICRSCSCFSLVRGVVEANGSSKLTQRDARPLADFLDLGELSGPRTHDLLIKSEPQDLPTAMHADDVSEQASRRVLRDLICPRCRTAPTILDDIGFEQAVIAGEDAAGRLQRVTGIELQLAVEDLIFDDLLILIGNVAEHVAQRRGAEPLRAAWQFVSEYA
jgi:hypothetical protein